MEIVWSPHSLVRIEEIGDFIAQDSPAQAKKFIDHLIKAVERLQTHPHSGQAAPENPAFRQLIVRGYRIIYRIDQEDIQIVTVISPGLEPAKELSD